MRNIMITGFTGFLGTHLVKELSIHSNVKTFGFTRREKMDHVVEGVHRVYTMTDWMNCKIPFEKIDLVIHCGFARESNGAELAKSLDFSSKFMNDSVSQGVSSLINISSQSVYGSCGGIHSENDDIKPSYPYALAKYASEIITANAAKDVSYTNIRLAGLAGGRPAKKVGVLPLFVKKVIENESIMVKDGNNILSFMDVRDAASGIASLAMIDPTLWQSVYNLGNDWQISVIDLAKEVLEVGTQFCTGLPEIIIENLDRKIDTGLIIDRIQEQTAWAAQYSLEDIITTLFYDMTGC